MTDTNLLPCPFCGGDDLTVGAYGIERDGQQPSDRAHAVACNGCGSLGKEVAPRIAAIGAWNRRAQPAEADGVSFGFDDRSVVVSQEAYSIFMDRERALQDTLSAVTAERDELRLDAERYRWLRLADWWSSPICAVKDPKSQAKPGTDCPTRDRLDAAIDAVMAAKEG